MNDTGCARELPPTVVVAITASRDTTGLRKTAQRLTRRMTIRVRMLLSSRHRLTIDQGPLCSLEDSSTSISEAAYSKYRAPIGRRAEPRNYWFYFQHSDEKTPLVPRTDVPGTALVQLRGSAGPSRALSSDGGHYFLLLSDGHAARARKTNSLCKELLGDGPSQALGFAPQRLQVHRLPYRPRLDVLGREGAHDVVARCAEASPVDQKAREPVGMKA